MTRRKQTQPMQRKNSEDGGLSQVDDEEETTSVGDRPSFAELSDQEQEQDDQFAPVDRDDELADSQMVAEHVRSPSPSGTDVDVGSGCSSSTPPSLNDEDDSLHSSLRDVIEHRHVTKSSDAEMISSKISSGADRENSNSNNATRGSKEPDTIKLEYSAPPTSPTVTASSIESTIGGLFDKYSLRQGDMATSGLGSSVARLESFVASVATVDTKPPSVGSMLQLPPPPVSATQPVQMTSPVPTQSSGRHHSKPSKSKSIASGIGRHSSKSGGGKLTSKTVVGGSSSSSALGLLMTQNPTSLYSTVGMMAPIVPFQCVAGASGAAASTAAVVAAGTRMSSADQPLDLSSKSSRHETKYLSPDVSSNQGASSLLNLERQFGKGSTIFDRIGTKAWAAPYCAAAMRFGLATYPATTAIGPPSALTIIDSAPHHTMAPPPPPPSLHTGGSSSSKSACGGRSAGVGKDDMHSPRVPTRRGHCSPSDASSLLPWAQPPVLSDLKKHSPSLSNASAQQHMHTNFRCSCGTTTDTLYDLTLHVQKTGHSPAPPPSTVAQLASDNDTVKARSGASATGSRSTAGSGGTGTGSTSSSSSSKPYEYSKLVRGQDVWLSGGGERTRRSILRCIECGESFRSLPELTVHMVHTRHYTNIVGSGSGSGPNDSTPSGGSSANHHHHHQQQQQHRKHSSTSTGDKFTSGSGSNSARSKCSPLAPPRLKKELTRTPPTDSNSANFGPVASTRPAILSPLPRPESRGEAIDSVGNLRFDDRDRKSLVSTAYSSDDEDDTDSVARTPSRPRRDGDGGSSSCGGSRTSSPAGSTMSTPAVGLKRPWSRMNLAADDEVVERRPSLRPEHDGNQQTDQLDDSRDDRDIRVSESVSEDQQRHLVAKRSRDRPSTPVDFCRRLSPDGMSAEKKTSSEHGDVELKPLSPTNTFQSSLSAIKAMESFIRSSFGLNEHKEAVPSTPRSTGSPRYSNSSDKSALSKLNDIANDETVHLSSPKSRSRAPVEESLPTDLTSSISRHRQTADFDVKSNVKTSQSATKKSSLLTGSRDADSSTSVAGENSFSGNEEEAMDCRTIETTCKSSTREEQGKTMHGRKRLTDDEQHLGGQDSKHVKNEDHQRESYSNQSNRPQHKSTKDDQQYVTQERPSSSSTSIDRRSALESLHGLVYGQSLNTEHPLDSLQRLIYGGAAGVGAATAADVGLTAEIPAASAFGSGTASLMGGVGAGFMNDLIHGHSVTAGKGPFGSTTTAFHSSLLGPQTLILVNPIVTVVSQAGGGATGGGSSLSITLPGHPAAAAASAASPSMPLHPLNFSKSSSGESSSSSAGSSPSDIGACSATAATGNSCAVDLPSAGDGSVARPSTPPPRIYRCRACRRKFSSKGSYRYHLSRCHVLASSSLPASKSPKAASEPPATANTAVASATASVTSGSDVNYRSASTVMSSMTDSGEVHSSNAVKPNSGATSTATANLSGTPYGGCLPLNGSARLQTRYLAMDAGAQ